MSTSRRSITLALPAGLLKVCARMFRRCKKHHDREPLDDVAEGVFDPGGDEYDRPGVHIERLFHPIGPRPHLRPATCDVVDLVLSMRFLVVRRACVQDIHPDTERGHPEKLEVGLLGIGKHLGKIEYVDVHGTPRKHAH